MEPPVLFSGLTIDLDITYILVLALFFIPLLILNGMVFGPFRQLFEERHEKLQGALQKAETRVEEAETRAKAFEDKIRVATTRGLEARNQIRLEAQKVMNERIEGEKKKLEEQLGQALAEINVSRDRAMQDVLEESSKLGALSASRLLGRPL